MAKKSSKEPLLSLFEGMDETGQRALYEYAEFLSDRHRKDEPISTEPLQIERPAEESVVVAIQRLSKTYPMLDKESLLHETSSFMMRHMMQGEAAETVIDELEVYFSSQYELHIEQNNDATDA